MGTFTSRKRSRLSRASPRARYVSDLDGARIANAAASLGQTLRQATRDLGVDVLCFGGTKNGIMAVKPVVFFHSKLGADFLFLRKQAMQLASKMRFIAVQLGALLTDDLGSPTHNTPTVWQSCWKMRFARSRR